MLKVLMIGLRDWENCGDEGVEGREGQDVLGASIADVFTERRTIDVPGIVAVLLLLLLLPMWSVRSGRVAVQGTSLAWVVSGWGYFLSTPFCSREIRRRKKRNGKCESWFSDLERARRLAGVERKENVPQRSVQFVRITAYSSRHVAIVKVRNRSRRDDVVSCAGVCGDITKDKVR